jgi:hypothetical protein
VSSNVKRSVPVAGASGVSLKVALTITARLPNDPVTSRPRSYPATFFTTLPPALTSCPSGVARRTPISRSRGRP